MPLFMHARQGTDFVVATMDKYCLSGHPTRPCFVLKFKGTTVMLDCALDASTVLRFLPLPLVSSAKIANLPAYRDCGDAFLEGELRECSGRVFVDGAPEFCPPENDLVDFSEVDVILVSNYLCMMALPYVTEHTGFAGVVYATEPTLQVGRQFMQETLSYVERSPMRRRSVASRWKRPELLRLLPLPLAEAFKPHTWRQWFNAKDLQASLARVQTIGFVEKRDVFGAVTVTAISSGYCLGSCNWIIASDHETVAYISASSTLTTHPKPMDWTPLRNADVLIWCGITQTPTYNPDTMLSEFCATVATTVRNGGNVLIPSHPSGVIYDLFECLSIHLDGQGLSLVPMYFVSPVADISLACSNVYAEWLSQTKQSKVYLPEEPFPHGQLVRNNRLRPFASLHSEALNADFRCPCVVFAGHPSLRFGDAVHFLELWGGSHSNTIIFTEPEFPYLDVLGPFQPLAMKAVYCPIDTSQNFGQANKQLRDLKPRHLVIPEQYTVPPLLHPSRTDLVIECESKPFTFKRGDVLSLPVKRTFERMALHPELAASLVPQELKAGIGVATVTGSLSVKDNKCVLSAVDQSTLLTLPTATPSTSRRQQAIKLGGEGHPSSYTWGTLDVNEFVRKIAQAGISDVKVEERQADFIIHLQNEDTIIQAEDRATHIMCNNDEGLRRTLKDILLQCLNRFD